MPLHELKLSKSVVTVSESIVKGEVEWAAPLADEAMGAAKKELARLQQELEREFEAESAQTLDAQSLAVLPSAAGSAQALLSKLSDEVMPRLARAVEEVSSRPCACGLWYMMGVRCVHVCVWVSIMSMI